MKGRCVPDPHRPWGAGEAPGYASRLNEVTSIVYTDKSLHWQNKIVDTHVENEPNE